MAELIPGVKIDVRGLIAIEHVQSLLVRLVAQGKLVVLLPQVTLQNFDCRQEPQYGSIPATEPAAKSRSVCDLLCCHKRSGWKQHRAAQADALYKAAPAQATAGVGRQFLRTGLLCAVGRRAVMDRIVLHVCST